MWNFNDWLALEKIAIKKLQKETLSQEEAQSAIQKLYSK